MNEPIAYWNGQLLPAAEVALALTDAGCTWGAMVVDRLRTFGQRLYRLDDHIARFQRSCYGAYIRQGLTDARLAALAREVVEHNLRLLPAGGELSLVMLATPGPGDGAGPPTLCLHTQPLDFARYRHLFQRGAVLVFCPVVELSEVDDDREYGIDPRVKHRSRLHWWAAREQLRDEGRADPTDLPLFCNPRDDFRFTETPTANVLFVIDGIIYSPPRRRILNGIALDTTQTLCQSLGLPFVELTYDDLADDPDPVELSFPLFLDPQQRQSVQEVLLTCSSFGVCGVSGYRHHHERFAVPWPGPYLKQLLAAWSETVGVDLAEQFLRD
jgi:branched-chain amino acid aminotransferase